MRLSQVLQGKGREVVTVGPDSDVRALVRLLRQHGVGAVVVSPDGRQLAGIVSERDVVRALAERGTDVLTEPVKAIATAMVHTSGPDTRVEDLMVLMTTRRIRHVPVLVDGALAGIVSIGDVVKSYVDQLAGERDALEQYVTSAG